MFMKITISKSPSKTILHKIGSQQISPVCPQHHPYKWHGLHASSWYSHIMVCFLYILYYSLYFCARHIMIYYHRTEGLFFNYTSAFCNDSDSMYITLEKLEINQQVKLIFHGIMEQESTFLCSQNHCMTYKPRNIGLPPKCYGFMITRMKTQASTCKIFL
jgi:hypothetical protein